MIRIYKYNKQRENSLCFCKWSQRLELMSVISLFHCSFHIFLALSQNLSWSVFTWWSEQIFISKGLNPKWVRTSKTFVSHASAPQSAPTAEKTLNNSSKGHRHGFAERRQYYRSHYCHDSCYLVMTYLYLLHLSELSLSFTIPLDRLIVHTANLWQGLSDISR